jgi:hypothetical protein
MGRAAGCPASPGRVGTVRTAAGGVPAVGPAGDCTGGAAERAAGAPGPDATRTGSGARIPPGRGWRGPERTCPGLGPVGMGLGGCGTGRMGALAAGACGVGDEVASGGRNRCGCVAILGGNFSSMASRAGSASCTASGACGFSTCAGAALGASSVAVTAPLEADCSARSAAPALPPKKWRSFSATSSSIELE